MKGLVLTMKAPVMSCGTTSIDGLVPTDTLPGLSALVGLVGNAMGLERTDMERLQALQENLVFGVRADREGVLMRDFQTSRLSGKDKGWTRRGVEGRAGGAATYDNPIIRNRWFLADAFFTAILATPGREDLLEEIRDALVHPRRPLFFGRKTNLPAGPVIDPSRPVTVEAGSIREALEQVPAEQDGSFLARWPAHEDGGQIVRVRDMRDWKTRVHQGTRNMKEGRVTVRAAA